MKKFLIIISIILTANISYAGEKTISLDFFSAAPSDEFPRAQNHTALYTANNDKDIQTGFSLTSVEVRYGIAKTMILRIQLHKYIKQRINNKITAYFGMCAAYNSEMDVHTSLESAMLDIKFNPTAINIYPDVFLEYKLPLTNIKVGYKWDFIDCNIDGFIKMPINLNKPYFGVSTTF